MIQSLLLWAFTAFASPAVEDKDIMDMSDFISYQKLSPGASVAFIPVTSREHNKCVFALALETQDAPVDLTSIKIAFDDDDMRHRVPLGKRHFPKTDGQFTLYLMVLTKNIAIIKTESYGKSGRVIMSRSETGECSFSQI